VIFCGRQIVDRKSEFDAESIAAKIQDTMKRRGMYSHKGRNLFCAEQTCILKEAVLLKRGEQYKEQDLGTKAIIILLKAKVITAKPKESKGAKTKKPKAAPENKAIKAPAEDK
jgi:hypothetical protein